MSRPLRLEYAGALYHVTARGNERKAIYWEEADFEMYLGVLAEVCKRFNWVIHSYCLMTNHYHLLVETLEGNLSQGMRQLNGVYTQRFNRKYQRVGHLYQGRYKAILVDKESYLLELARYIVLNPVRAKGMVDDPSEWEWSSYLATIGRAEAPDWLAVDALLSQFAKQRRVAIEKYQAFIGQGIGINVWGGLQSQVFLGSDEFVEAQKRRLQEDSDTDLSEIPKKQVRKKARPISYYQSQFVNNKHKGMVVAYQTGQYSMNEIAQVFGVHYSTVSRAIAKCKT